MSHNATVCMLSERKVVVDRKRVRAGLRVDANHHINDLVVSLVNTLIYWIVIFLVDSGIYPIYRTQGYLFTSY